MLLFFFNDTATTEIYTLSLHDALPILFRTPDYTSSTPLTPLVSRSNDDQPYVQAATVLGGEGTTRDRVDRKSTRLNSSHANISYAVFCLKKKKPRNCIPLSHHRSITQR